MLTADQIVAMYDERKTHQLDMHTAMRSIRDIYRGKLKVNLPDMDRNEDTSVPNLIGQGVDQMAARVASVSPIHSFVPRDSGSRREVRRAATAGKVTEGWAARDKVPSKMRYRARHLVAYGMSPVVVRWDRKTHTPIRQVRSPLDAFPSLDLIPGTVTPADCIFTLRRTVAWLKANGYGDAVDRVLNGDLPPETQMLLLQYVGPEGDYLVLTGISVAEESRDGDNIPPQHRFYGGGRRAAVMLEASPPITDGISPVVIPTRIGLDDVAGQFDTMTGMYYQQAKLMALEVLAVEKGIFPDTVLESRPNETARIVDGPHDGRTGLITVVQGGTLREIATQPGYMTPSTIDRLERNQRVTAGIPADFGGESGTNIRTGRRGDAVLASTIDFPIAEAQDVFAQSMVEENRAAIALAKKMDGNNPRTIYVGNGNNARAVTYEANKVFESDEHTVYFPVTGTDMNGMLVAIGQRIGQGTMSKRTGASLDPFIADAEYERDQITVEALEQALIGGFQQQAANGEIPPLVLAKVMDLVGSDKMELAEAIAKVTQEAAEEQAAAAEMGPHTPSPEELMAPAAQQALAGGASPMPGATPGQEDLSQLLGALRRPVMAVSDRSGGVDAGGRALV